MSLRRGYERASLNRMIKDAGLSKGTFYYYFEDKADLFVTVLRVKLPWEAWVSESGLLAAAEPDAFWGSLEGLEKQKYAYLGQYPSIARLSEALAGLSDSHFENASLAAYAKERLTEARGIVEHGRRIEAVRRDLPMQLLLNLWTGIARSLSEWIFEDWEALSQMEREQRAKIAFETLQRVIGVSGQGVRS